MRRSRLVVVGLLAVSAIIAACTDRQPAPTEATSLVKRRGNTSSCMDLAGLTAQIQLVFGTTEIKMPNTNSALKKLDLINKKLQKNTAADTADAQAHTRDLLEFIRIKTYELADQTQVQTLIDALECFAGITSNTALIKPLDAPTTVYSSTGHSGVQFPGDAVNSPTLVTVTELLPSDSGLLVTKLDKYPGFINVHQSSSDPDSNSLRPGVSVTVEVCPSGVPSADIRARLRLGHQSSIYGFQITPAPTTASFLDCSAVASNTASHLPGWMRSLASLVMPKPLYARMMFAGGVGGTAEEFSPFGTVDPMLSLAGGVGGTAEEFIKEQPNTPEPSKKRPTAADDGIQGKSGKRNVGETVVGVTTCYQAEVGASARTEGCQPKVTLLTPYYHTPMVGVPVTFTVGEAGGTVANAASNCAAPGSSVTVLTDATGTALACWTLADTAATYTVTATPALGGDAVPGVNFSPTSYSWTTTGIKHNATLALSDLSYTYDGNEKSATVTTSPVAGLPGVNVTYDGAATLPKNAGTYAVLATLNNPSYQAAPASATLVISRATQADLTVGGPISSTYNTTTTLSASGGTGDGAISYQTSGPCSVTDGNVLHVNSGTGSCTVTATKSGGNNYNDISASATITLTKATATLTLGNLTPTYSGAQNIATVTTAPEANLSSIAVTYSGSGTAPTDAGTYAVAATLTNDNYTGSTTGTMAVAKAEATVIVASTSVPYTGTQKSVTVSTNPTGLAGVNVTYNGDAALPVNAGSYAVSATLNNPNYVGSGTGTLTITPQTTSITWGTPANITLGTPLSGTQLNAAASTGGTFVYTPPAGTVLPAGPSTLSTAFTAASTNYTNGTATVNINVWYKQNGCFASPVYSSMPDTKSYQRLGSNLQVKCALSTVNGTAVMNATGKIEVQDAGTVAVPNPTVSGPIWTIDNAFKVSTGGNYAYGMDTGIPVQANGFKFVSLRYYRIKATWNDGSTTVGYFFVK